MFSQNLNKQERQFHPSIRGNCGVTRTQETVSSTSSHNCVVTTILKRSRIHSNQLKVVNLIKQNSRGQTLGCFWVSAILLLYSTSSLFIIQESCQTVVSSNNIDSVPFKTSFFASSDYSIRRNGALLSVPTNVEQIQRDQADSIIHSPPAFEPTSEDENFALINRELNFLQREEQKQSEPRPGDIGVNRPTQVHSYLQVLEDLVASPSAETSTGQVEPNTNNGTSSLNVTTTITSSMDNATTVSSQINEQEPMVTTLSSRQVSSTSGELPSTTSQSVSSTTTTTDTTVSSTAAPTTTTTSAPVTTTIATVPSTQQTPTATIPTVTRGLAETTSVAPTGVVQTTTTSSILLPTVADANSSMSLNEQVINLNNASSVSTTIQPPMEQSTTTSTGAPQTVVSSVDHQVSTTAPNQATESSSSQAPESTSSAAPVTTTTSLPLPVTTTLKPETVQMIDNTKSGNHQVVANGTDSNQDQTVAKNGTAANREARGRETICRFGEPNCSYMIATVPVVDKWNSNDHNHNNRVKESNKTGGSSPPPRVVNEFVFVPNDDSNLSFEDSSYSTRRPGNKETETATLKAEHRTIDGEGDIESGVGAPGSGDMEDVELDYIISDIEPLSGKSAVGPTNAKANTSGVQQSSMINNNNNNKQTSSTTETIFSSTRQPTTLRPQLPEVSSSMGVNKSIINNQKKETSSTQSAIDLTVPTTTTTTQKPTVRVSTSQSFSVRASSSPLATSGGSVASTVQQQTVRQTKPLEGQVTSTSTTTTTTTTPLPTTTRRTNMGTARPNQKLMRIGEQSLPMSRITTTIQPQVAASSSSPITSQASISSSSSSSITASTPMTTSSSSTVSSLSVVSPSTRRPAAAAAVAAANFDWRRGELSATATATSGNRRPKSSRFSQHRQFFSEPAGDLRRRPTNQNANSASALKEFEEEEEAAKILTRYTISSQLSRLSAATGLPVETTTTNTDNQRRKSVHNNDQQRRSTAQFRSSLPQKSELKRLEPQQSSSSVVVQAMGGSSPGDEKHLRNQFDSRQIAPVVVEEQQENHRTRDDSTVSRDEKPSLAGTLVVGAQQQSTISSTARSLTKQELAIEHSMSSGSSIGQQQQQQHNKFNSPLKLYANAEGARNVAPEADLHRGSINILSLDNVSDRQLSATSSLRDLSNVRSVIGTTSVNGSNSSSSSSSGGGGGGHTSDTNHNTSSRLLLPTTTTPTITTTTSFSSSHTTLKPDTSTSSSGGSSSLQNGSKPEIAPMTTTTTKPAMTKFDHSTRTMTTTTIPQLAIPTILPVTVVKSGQKRESDLQVDNQTTEELMTLIAQSALISSSLSALSNQQQSAERSSSLLLQDRQVRAEPRQAASEKVSTTLAPVLNRSQQEESTSTQATAFVADVRRQQQAVTTTTLPILSNKRAAVTTTPAAKTDGRRLVDELDEYEGSIEDQLAKDALHYQAPAANAGGTRKTNSYTLKVRHGNGGLAVSSSTTTMDTGKWQPSASDDSASMASSSEDSGQPSGGNPLPGRPGIDYPIHWQVPKTSFDCRNYEQSGFYADVESDCQAYHSCHKGRGGRHTFLCPNGTLFSQELLTCDWWYNVECSSSKLYLTNDGNTNSLEAKAQFSDTNSRPNTNELSM